MTIPTQSLSALIAIARHKRFSKAADALHITQSALSQRIANMEKTLGTTLVIRDPQGIKLTEAGRHLVRYGQMQEHLEAEVLEKIRADKTDNLSGVIRIAGFSTITRSVILPVLTKLTHSFSRIQLELMSRELHELPSLLESGSTDFIFLTTPSSRNELQQTLLGYEDYVLIKPTSKRNQLTTYLDNDPADLTTQHFFNQQTNPPKKWSRHFLDNIDLIIEGVRAGLGNAIAPLHLVKNQKGLEIDKRYKTLRIPVYLTYFKQAYYTALQRHAIELLTREIPPYFAR